MGAIHSRARPRWVVPRSTPELAGRRAATRGAGRRAEPSAGRQFPRRVAARRGRRRQEPPRTRLLARHPEVTGLAAQVYPLAASAAFALWTDALDPFLEPLSDDEVVELCGGLLDDLASLFHRVALVRGAVPDRDPPLPRLLRGLTQLLGNRVAPNCRWSYCSTTCTARTRRRGRRCASSLGTSTTPASWSSQPAVPRTWPSTPPPRPCCSSSSRMPSCLAWRSAPLPRPAIRELAEAVIERPAPRALVDWISERSQGNPLFAIGLLRALLDERGDLSAPQLERLPEGLTDRVTSELRGFDAAPRALLELLAVVGRPFAGGSDRADGRHAGGDRPASGRAGRGADRARGGAGGESATSSSTRSSATSSIWRRAPHGGGCSTGRRRAPCSDRTPGRGGAALRPLGRPGRLGGGGCAARRDATGRAARGVP